MTFPSVDLYPGPDVFPGSPLPVTVDGYKQATVELSIADLVLTATDGAGVDWVAEVLTGWFGSPASTIQPQNRANAPGAYPGPRQLDKRPLTIAGTVEAPTTAALQDAFDRLNEAASLDGSLLTVALADTTRSMIVYRQGEVNISMLSATTAVWSIQVLATDPRKFAASLTMSTALPSTVGGFGFPMKIPFGIPAQVITGNVALFSPGNYPGPVFIRIDGPVIAPFITHVSSGQRLTFREALTLGPGEWLDIDMENKLVLANGTANRDGFIADRGWSSFTKGSNLWAFGAAFYSPLARARITAIPAWQ